MLLDLDTAKLLQEEPAGLTQRLSHFLRDITIFGCVRIARWYAWTSFWSALTARKLQFAQEHGTFLYIAYLVTIPNAQGQGLGSAILRAITAEADQQDICCYVETTTQGACRLYRRHGFEIIDALDVLAPHMTLYVLARWRKSHAQK